MPETTIELECLLLVAAINALPGLATVKSDGLEARNNYSIFIEVDLLADGWAAGLAILTCAYEQLQCQDPEIVLEPLLYDAVPQLGDPDSLLFQLSTTSDDTPNKMAKRIHKLLIASSAQNCEQKCE